MRVLSSSSKTIIKSYLFLINNKTLFLPPPGINVVLILKFLSGFLITLGNNLLMKMGISHLMNINESVG